MEQACTETNESMHVQGFEVMLHEVMESVIPSPVTDVLDLR